MGGIFLFLRWHKGHSIDSIAGLALLKNVIKVDRSNQLKNPEEKVFLPYTSKRGKRMGLNCNTLFYNVFPFLQPFPPPPLLLSWTLCNIIGLYRTHRWVRLICKNYLILHNKEVLQFINTYMLRMVIFRSSKAENISVCISLEFRYIYFWRIDT